jgi:hypothetical protein
MRRMPPAHWQPTRTLLLMVDMFLPDCGVMGLFKATLAKVTCFLLSASATSLARSPAVRTLSCMAWPGTLNDLGSVVKYSGLTAS